jgi:hypothetical protein
VAKDTNFSSGDVLPSAYVNRQQEVDSASAWGVRLLKLNSTTVRVAATATAVADEGNGTAQSGIRIGGKPRYVTAPVDVTISGGAATFKVYLTAGAGPGFTGGFTSGAIPADSRKIGEADWDGSAITAVRQMVDSVPGHGYSHRVGGEDELPPASAGASQIDSSVASVIGLTQPGSPRSGKCIVATTETRTNTAFGLLTTPDRVSGIVVATDSVLEVDYQALWKTNGVDFAQAAIFIGANQLRVQAAGAGTHAPQVEAALQPAETFYTPVFSIPIGLASVSGGSASDATVDVTTGQAFGSVTFGTYHKIAINDVSLDVVIPTGGGGASDAGMQGGTCRIFGLAAGTYDVSVQFKALSGGTVSVKNRRLFVRSRAF